MVWQDLAMTITNIVMGYAVVPQVFNGFKTKKGSVELQTSAITTLGIFVFAGIFITMGMFLSASVSIFNGAMWSLLLFQKLVYK